MTRLKDKAFEIVINSMLIVRLKHKLLAILTTTILVLISIFGVSGNNLASMRQEISLIFEQGTPLNPMSIQQQLDVIAGQSSNILIVAGRYLNDNNEFLSSVQTSHNNFITAKTPTEKYQAKKILLANIQRLNKELDMITPKVSQRDASYLSSALVNIESSERIIRNNQYNAIATEFNKALKRFPANIISRVRNINMAYIYG